MNIQSLFVLLTMAVSGSAQCEKYCPDTCPAQPPSGKCPAGCRKYNETCVECPPGNFSMCLDKSPHCKKCLKCPSTEVVKSNCTKCVDTTCGPAEKSSTTATPAPSSDPSTKAQLENISKTPKQMLDLLDQFVTKAQAQAVQATEIINAILGNLSAQIGTEDMVNDCREWVIILIVVLIAVVQTGVMTFIFCRKITGNGPHRNKRTEENIPMNE